MSIQIKFFGQIADVAGTSDMQVQNVNDTDSLRAKMISDFPQLKNYQFVVAVDKKIVNGNQMLHSNNVVAFLPPFAGG